MAETFPYVEGQGTQNLNVETAVFPQELPIEVPTNLQEVASQAALVENSHSGKDYNQQVAESTQDINTMGMDEVRRSIAAKEKETQIQAAETAVKNAPSADTATYYQQILQRHQGPPEKQALEQAVVDIITPTDAVSYYTDFNKRENAKDLAARNIIYETLIKGTPGDGWWKDPTSATFWNMALSLGRDIIGFVNPRAVSSAVAEALEKKNTWGDVFNPDQIINEFRNAYALAPAGKKQELVQALIHGLERTSSFLGDKNTAQVAINLGRVLEQSKTESIESTIFDVAGLPIATAASALMKGARMAKEIGKPANVAIRSGNPEVAVNMMVSDAVRKTEVSGMTTDEIARAATSMNMTPMELSLTNLKVNQTLQEKLRMFASDVRKNIQDTLMPSNISPTQISKGAEFYDEIYSASRNKAVYEYTPSGYQDGAFTGSLKWQSADGVPFASREAAEVFAKDLGKVGTPERVGESYDILSRHYPGVTDQTVDTAKLRVDEATQVGKPKRIYSKDGALPEASLGDEYNYYLQGPTKKDKQGRFYYDQTQFEIPSQWIFHEKINNPLPIESIGTYTLQDVSGRNWWNFKIPMLSASFETVKQAGLALSANAKIRRGLERAYKDSIKGLSGEERGMVTKALADGDTLSNQAGAFGHVFDSIELGGRGFSDKAIEAYYQQRIIRDSMWLQRNKQMVYEFRAQGMKELAFPGNEHVQPLNVPAKPLDVGSIKSLNTQGKIGKVLNTTDGTVVNLTTENLDALYQGGGQILRLYKPQVINGRKFTHIVVDSKTNKMRDITTPLPYRPGEFSRVYTDEYFITHAKNVADEFDRLPGQPGYEKAPSSTVRTAKDAKEAKAFSKGHNDAVKFAFLENVDDTTKLRLLEQAIGKWTSPKDFLAEAKSGAITKDSKFDFHYNRETHSYLEDTIDEGLTNGRLFYSRRGDKLLSTDPARSNTLDVLQSLGVELANISRFITSKDIRVDAIERWMNTFGHGLVNPSHNKMADFVHQPLDASKIKEGLISEGSKLSDLSSSELLKFAEQEREYIKRQLNIRTQTQKTNAEQHRRASEWIEGALRKAGANKIADWFGPAMRQSNVPDFLRGVNFNISLAAGNVAQLLVQANGMMIAAARHPLHGLAAAKMAIPLRMALMSDNPNVWKTMATIDSLTSFGLKNINEFSDIVQAVKKSGILADVKSTAMFNVEEGALDLYKGYGREFIKEAGPFFFNRGEEFSRLVSWEVSRREWAANHIGESWKTDNALRDISARQKEYNLGMQSHNTAVWQHGWTGIPMQFLQYNVKLLAGILHTTMQLGKDINKNGWKALTNFENGNYRQFNPAEALAVAGSQVVLYGVAGNGLQKMANEIWGDESNLSMEQKMYISEGLAGGLLYSLTKEMDQNGKEDGLKLALGSRLGSFNWYNQIFDKITQDKTPTSDFLLGATKSNGVKVFDLIHNLARLFYYSDEVTPNMILDELSHAPEVFASWGNATKAYTYMQNEGIVTSKDGEPLARLNTKENLAAFLGITSVQIQEYYETVKDEQKLYKDLSDLSKEIHKLQIRQWNAVKDGDQKLADDLEKLRWVMMPRDPAHRRFVDQHLKEKLWPGDTATDKIRREFTEKMNQENERFRVFDKEQ